MKKTILFAAAALALLGCHSHDAERAHIGGPRTAAIPLGPQPVAIALTTGTNANVSLSPGNDAPSTIVRLTPAAGGSTVCGFDSSSASDGDMYVIRNDSTTDNIILTNADGSCSTHNQMLLSAAGSVTLPPKTSMFIEFDKTAAEWVQGPGHNNAPTFTGSVTQVASSGVETVTSGALSQTKKTLLSVTGTQAYTLADCTASQLGLHKEVEETVAASTPLGTLTLTTVFNGEPTTHVFTAIGQTLVFECEGASGWHIVGKKRAGQQAVVVGTTVLTGIDMAETYELSVTGTVASTSGGKGIPNCYFPGERIHVSTPTAASTPSGSISIAGFTSATGVAAATLGTINATTVQADFVCDGVNWQNVSVTTATYSLLEFASELMAA